MRDPYTILGIPSGADDRTIRRAYKKLAVENHPDRNNDPAAVNRFKEVAEAYAVLTNEEERKRYLRRRRREHAEQEEMRRRADAAARRRAEEKRSATVTAAEEAFWNYARQVKQRREQQQSSPQRPQASRRKADSSDDAGHTFGKGLAVLLTVIYIWRSHVGLPLQPWLSAETFGTHSLASPIWITLSFSLLMILKPKIFLIPFLIEGVRDVRLAGWFMFLVFPFVSAAGSRIQGLMYWGLGL